MLKVMLGQFSVSQSIFSLKRFLSIFVAFYNLSAFE